jgi:16S rRNA (adenine1518-N6/adenine1519-N6)-dimethyltransferase
VLDPRHVLRNAGLSPKKSFGQNFLVAEKVAEAIATACVPDDERGLAAVIELGAGAGALTSLLLPRARRVVAVERDRDLVPVLRDAFAADVEAGRLDVLEGDAQAVAVAELLGPRDASQAAGATRVLAGNLPYQITGRLLQLAVVQAAELDRVVFMVQEEVADRLVAAPATKAYGALTVFVRAAFDVRLLRTVSRGCFFPSPDVTSAVIVLTPLRPPRAEETDVFRAVVRAAFAMRRKTLRNAWAGLAPADALADAARAADVSLDARGETLDVDAFARFAAALEGQRGAPSSDASARAASARSGD